MPDGWKNFWSCPGIITGTTPLKKRASTRTLPFIFRGSINFLELTTILTSGRNATDWTASRLRPAFCGRRLNHLPGEKERLERHFKNPVPAGERRGAALRPSWLLSPGQEIS